MKWLRYRFSVDSEDYRPVVFPPPGPYWRSGYNSGDHAVLIAYLPPGVDILIYWPEAVLDDDTPQEREEITFTDRFARPEWWEEES